MFPIGDDNSTRTSTPIVTYALIVLNVLGFLAELNGGERFILEWAFVPRRFLEHPHAEFTTLFTAMFMHAGWMHLGGNMLYLWIFGDNVEDRLGHGLFLMFYLVCGLVATFAQLAVGQASNVPNLGASGAIAGVLGAYILMFPGAQVRVMMGRGIVPMPALVVIGLWIVLQLFSGIGSLANAGDVGGIAYMAHIGGFFTGLALAFVLRGRGPTRV
jgi:rhomboid family protein